MTGNPKSKTILYLWIAGEIAVFGWLGWQWSRATVRPWAQPRKKVSLR